MVKLTGFGLSLPSLTIGTRQERSIALACRSCMPIHEATMMKAAVAYTEWYLCRGLDPPVIHVIVNDAQRHRALNLPTELSQNILNPAFRRLLLLCVLPLLILRDVGYNGG
jgi:hypothetical protein